MQNDDISNFLKRHSSLIKKPQEAIVPVEEKEENPFFDIGDTALAVPRGVGNAAGEIYDFVDAVAFDVLPDTPEGPLFGESKSTVGGVVEGITQFATAFIPGLNFLKAGGKVTKSVKLFKGLSTSAETALIAKGSSTTMLLAKRAALAGAFTDAVAFDPHEERLSNLIQSYPQLSNGVNEFLASSPEDGEAESRLKAALEGLVLGGVIDGTVGATKALFGAKGLLAGLTGIRARRAALAEGMAKKEADKIAQEAYREVTERTEKQGHDSFMEFLNAGKADGSGPRDFSPELDPTFTGPVQDDVADALKTSESVERRVVPMPEAKAKDGKKKTPVVRNPSREALENLVAEEAKESTTRAREHGFRSEEITRVLGAADSVLATGIDPTVNARTVQRDLAAEGEPFLTTQGHTLSPQDDILKIIVTGKEGNGASLPSHDLGAIQNGISTEIEGGITGALRGMKGAAKIKASKSFAETTVRAAELIAENSGRDHLEVLAEYNYDIMKTLEGQEAKAAKIHAAVAIADQATLEARNIMRIIGDTPHLASEADRLRAFQLMSGVLETLGVKDLSGTVDGRGLRVINAPINTMAPLDVKRHLDNMGGLTKSDKSLKRMLEIIDNNGMKGMVQVADEFASGKLLNLTLGTWVAGLVSGGRTFMANFTGNQTALLYRPMENVFGGMVGRTLNGSAASDELVQLGIGQFVGIRKSFMESMSLGWDAFKKNKGILRDGEQNTKYLEGTSRRGGFRDIADLTGEENVKDIALAWLGSAITLPFRGLGAVDEMFSQLAFRSDAYSRFNLKALNSGIPPKDIPGYIEAQMANLVKDGQAKTLQQAYGEAAERLKKVGITPEDPEYRKMLTDSVNENFDSDISDKALLGADEGTFQTPLRKGTIANTVSTGLTKHPILKFFQPFIKIPTNLVLFGAQRLDLPGYAAANLVLKYPQAKTLVPKMYAHNNRMMRDILSGDPELKAQALGRISAGISASMFFVGAAKSGNITGSGPADFEHRKMLEETGVKFNSILVGDKYYSYARMEPFSTIIGIAADLATFGDYTTQEDQSEVEMISSAFGTALFANVMNKTYMSGIKSLTDLASGKQAAGDFMEKFLPSFVPNYVNQFEDVVDPNLREVRNLLDAFKARIPGLSSDLPPVRNMLGEVVKKPKSVGADSTAGLTNFFIPVQYSALKEGPIMDELRVLNHSFEPPSRTAMGVNLIDAKDENGNALYDRYQELIGTQKVFGKTLKQSLTQLVKSRYYQSIPVNGALGEDSPRVAEFNKIIRSFRVSAMHELRKENPSLELAIRQQRQARLGISPALVQ